MSWGPVTSATAAIQQRGFSGSINDQFRQPMSLYTLTDPANNGANSTSSITDLIQHFYSIGTNNPDQLRQRVVFALSQIFSISNNKVGNHDQIAYFQNLLVTDAFTNYYQLMYDVTLSPPMGYFLDMMGSRKPSVNTQANENYSRELMQLFTLGLCALNNDGTCQHDAQGQQIQPFSEAQVQAMALALTGWDGSNGRYSLSPMVATETNHDTRAKTILSGVVLPARQTASQDLDGLLQAVFNHPNVPPFVCKQLIQHLVTSNPSPAYVNRVVNVFIANDAGVRGDMKSVIKAILLDTEARAGDSGSEDPAFGHLKDPVRWVTGMMRALNATLGDTNRLRDGSALLSETLFTPPSVFSFYAPGYKIGPALVGPEFQLYSGAQAVARASLAGQYLYNPGSVFLTLDFTAWDTAAAAGVTPFITLLNTQLLAGRMSSALQSAITLAYGQETTTRAKSQSGLFLVFTSPEYQTAY